MCQVCGLWLRAETFGLKVRILELAVEAGD